MVQTSDINTDRIHRDTSHNWTRGLIIPQLAVVGHGAQQPIGIARSHSRDPRGHLRGPAVAIAHSFSNRHIADLNDRQRYMHNIVGL